MACSDAAQSSQAGDGVIPWLDRQGTPSGLVGSTHAARPCGAADLAVTVGPTGAFHGEATQELTLRNRAADACFLAGVPQPQLADMPAQSQVISGQFAQRRLDLGPGDSARVLVGAPVGCAASASPKLSSSMRLRLQNGDAMTVQGTRINTECGPASVMDFSVVRQPLTPGPLSALQPSVVAPQSVARGAVLTYQVRIRNPSSVAVALSPCPSYTHGFGTNAARTLQNTLLLNCGAAPSIGAATTLVYQMKLHVLSSTATGPTKLFWRLEVPDGRVAGTLIAVT